MSETERNADLARRLGEVDPLRPLGPELHTAVMRLVPSFCIEAVALRMKDGEPEVLLRQRGMTEPSYPGQWHCPGSFYRQGEQTGDVLARLTKNESLGDVQGFEHVDDLLWNEERGDILSRIYLVDVRNEPSHARWSPVRALPQPMVAHHARIIIPIAVFHYCLTRGRELTDWLLRNGGIRT